MRLAYNTNFTETVFQGADVLEIWARFRSVRVWASVDGLGRRGELIRKDLDWPRLVENRRRMKEVCPEVEFRVNTVVSVLNVFHLPELQRALDETGFAALEVQEVHLAQEPPIYSIQSLTRGLKRRARRVLRAHARWLEEQARSGREVRACIEQIEAIAAYMDAAHLGVGERMRFAYFTPRLDRLREERLTTSRRSSPPCCGSGPSSRRPRRLRSLQWRLQGRLRRLSGRA